MTGVSIAALFTGGLLPGLVLGLVLCCVVRMRLRGPAGGAATPRVPWSEVGRSFVIADPASHCPLSFATR